MQVFTFNAVERWNASSIRNTSVMLINKLLPVIFWTSHRALVMASSHEFYTALQNSAPRLAVDWPMHALLAISWQVSHFWSHIQQFYMPYTYTAASSYFPGCQRLPRSGSFFTCRVLQTGTSSVDDMTLL